MSVALIGGIDPTGGAGLVRDQWAIESFARAHAGHAGHAVMGVPGLVIAPSAWTWQGDACEPARAQALTARAFARALVRVAEMAPRVIKIGLVPAQLIEPLVQWLGTQRARPQRVHVILDPVLRASDGGALGASVEGLWALIRLRGSGDAESWRGAGATRCAQPASGRPTWRTAAIAQRVHAAVAHQVGAHDTTRRSMMNCGARRARYLAFVTRGSIHRIRGAQGVPWPARLRVPCGRASTSWLHCVRPVRGLVRHVVTPT